MGTLWKNVVKVGLGAICAVTLSFVQPRLTPQGLSLSLSVSAALACGLGQTATMYANDQPALAYPSKEGQTNQPVGIFGPDYSANTEVKFVEDLSRLPTPIDPNAYIWDWNFGDGSHGSSTSTAHTYTKAGTYVVRLTLTDPLNGNLTDELDSAEIHVIEKTFDKAPVAAATTNGHFVQVGKTLSYDASGSRSSVGGDLTYTWNFGDATTATGEKVTHTFNMVGSGYVALIAQDNRGAKTVQYVQVTVAIDFPKAAISASALSAKAGQKITFDASGSQPPASAQSDTIARYEWDFGDGATKTTTEPTVTHTFDKGGTYQVSVDAVDSTGLPGSTSIQVNIDGNLGPWGTIAWTVVILLVLATAGLSYWLRTRDAERQRLALAAQRAQAAKKSRTKAKR